MTLQILRAFDSEREPPYTVKSWAKRYTMRPPTWPYPVTTPSPAKFSISKSAHRCWTNRSSSTKVPGSRRSSIRSRAVSFPWACWVSIRRLPPPSMARALRLRNSSNFSWSGMASS
jgi:hypothetical protein